MFIIFSLYDLLNRVSITKIPANYMCTFRKANILNIFWPYADSSQYFVLKGHSVLFEEF